MKLHTEGVSELVLEVRSMERAVDFWSTQLGFPIVAQWGYKDGQFDKNGSGEIWATWLYIGGNTRLGLWLPRNFSEHQLQIKHRPVSEWDNGLYDEGGVHVHFALYIRPERFDETVTLLQSLNIDVTVRVPDSGRDERSVYFKDTEGNLVEFYTKNMMQCYASEKN